jgi:drug/metabolite transporter (DMT)-like permease
VKSLMSGRVWIALVIVYVVWGSTYLAIKWSVQTMPALGSAAARFVVAGALLALFARMRRGSAIWRMEPARWRNAAICGVLLLTGGNGLVVLAETRVPSGLAALLVAVVPLWMIMLRGALGDRTPMLSMVGVLIGLGGAALLLLPGSGGHVNLGYSLLVVLAALSWAVGSVLVTRVPVPAEPMVMSSIEMMAGGTALVVAAAVRGEFTDLHLGAISTKSWLSLGYLIVFGSIVAFSAYMYALANGPAPLVATYAYVNPLVAVFLGVLLDHEHLTGTELVGGLVILASVGVVVSAEGRHRAKVAARAVQPRDECAVVT